MPLRCYNAGLILALRYNLTVAWNVEVTDEFKAWDGLTDNQTAREKSSMVLQKARPVKLQSKP